MNQANINNFGTVVANGCMVAAVELLRAQGRDMKSVDLDALVIALKSEAKVALTTILDDGKVLLDAHRSAWLETLVRTECVEAAKRAVASLPEKR